jgi:sensor domain CHASE-containing protein
VSTGQLWLVFWILIGALFLLLAASVPLFIWMVSHYRRLMSVTDQQQKRAQQQLEQADDHQRRSLELINRWDVLLAKIESLVNRLEDKFGT